MSEQPELSQPLLQDQQNLLLALDTLPLTDSLKLEVKHLIEVLDVHVECYTKMLQRLERDRNYFARQANTYALLRNSLQTALNRKKDKERDQEV